MQKKKTEAPWLYEASAHIGQQALVDLNRAFERFFKGLRGEGPRSGFPRFHEKGGCDSARLYEVTLEERHLRLPQTLVAVSGGTDAVGVDLGLHAAAVIHDGEATRVVEPQRALRSNLRKLRRLNRQLARKRRGSANQAKAKLELARLHYPALLDRDENATINLRRYGLRAVADELPEGLGEVTPVERKALTPDVHDGVKPASVKQEATARGSRRATRTPAPATFASVGRTPCSEGSSCGRAGATRGHVLIRAS